MFELNLEFQLYNLENAAIRVHALYNSLVADSSYLLLTGVDAYVSSSLLPFLYNIAVSHNLLRLRLEPTTYFLFGHPTVLKTFLFRSVFSYSKSA